MAGYRKPSAKDRSGKLQRQVGPDASSLQKGAKIGVRCGAAKAVKGYALVDALGDRLLLDCLETGEGQPFAGARPPGKTNS
jgi:hypothetical protein